MSKRTSRHTKVTKLFQEFSPAPNQIGAQDVEDVVLACRNLPNDIDLNLIESTFRKLSQFEFVRFVNKLNLASDYWTKM